MDFLNTKKIAIIYTGETRTIESTISTFKDTTLVNDNYHVFAVLQTDEADKYKTLLNNHMGGNLKSFDTCNKFDSCWHSFQNNLLTTIGGIVDQNWLNYLKTSGSMIEYYQMYTAYLRIVSKEYNEHFKYDYIIRIRCDTIIAQPILFDWDDKPDEYIKDLLYRIKNVNHFDTIISLKVFSIFMNTIYSHVRHISKGLSDTNIIVNEDINQLLLMNDEDLFISGINKYLKKGKFMIALRDNVVYFIKRKYFGSISNLALTYGLYKRENDDYWFNAENQLKQVCFDNEIDFFTSITPLEEKCLYNYNPQNYYDNDKLIQSNDFLFFIKRS